MDRAGYSLTSMDPWIPMDIELISKQNKRTKANTPRQPAPTHLDSHPSTTPWYAPPDSIISLSLKQSGDTSGDGSVDLHGLLGILRFIREKQVTVKKGAALVDSCEGMCYSTRLQSCKVLVGLAIMSGLDNECGWVWGDETPRMPYGWVGVSVHG